MTELEYHEKLYAGFAQEHFARPAVRALRRHMAERILRLTGAGKKSRVLSIGCGIGDTELLIAPRVGEVVGLDLSPNAVRQANADAAAAGIRNARFIEGTFAEDRFDVVIAIFFLHHLRDEALDRFPSELSDRLVRGGVFYSLDPNRYRLAGALGKIFVPSLMARYHSPDERELKPQETADRFRRAGYRARHLIYDFLSTPFAGLFPGWASGYRVTRAVDEALVRIPGLNAAGSNFEVVASKQ